ncbi:hypothetical protein WN943_014101 [Citrus x changshan-huyou]
MICDETKNQVKGVGSVKTTKIDNTFHQMMTENILEGEDIKKITNGIAESEKNMDGQNNNKIFEISQMTSFTVCHFSWSTNMAALIRQKPHVNKRGLNEM